VVPAAVAIASGKSGRPDRRRRAKGSGVEQNFQTSDDCTGNVGI